MVRYWLRVQYQGYKVDEQNGPLKVQNSSCSSSNWPVIGNLNQILTVNSLLKTSCVSKYIIKEIKRQRYELAADTVVELENLKHQAPVKQDDCRSKATTATATTTTTEEPTTATTTATTTTTTATTEAPTAATPLRRQESADDHYNNRSNSRGDNSIASETTEATTCQLLKQQKQLL